MYESFNLNVQEMVFEWDDVKAESNFQKHGIQFETAAKVFYDPQKLIRLDEEHDQEILRKRGMSMAITRMKLTNAELTAEEMVELERAEQMPDVFDEDCPEMTSAMLAQFQPMEHSILVTLSEADIKKLDQFGGVSAVGKLLAMVLNDVRFGDLHMQI